MAQLEVQLITGSYDHTLNFWEATTGQQVYSINYFDKNRPFIINRIEISRDKKRLAAACSAAALIYDISGQNMNTPIQNFDNYQGNVTSIGFNKSSKWIYTSSEDGTIKIHDLQDKPTGKNRIYTNKNKEPFNSVALHPNEGVLYAGDAAGNIKVYDITADKLREEIVATPDVAIRSVSMGQNGEFFVACDSYGKIHYYNTQNEEQQDVVTKILEKEGHNDYILKCLVSPDCKKLATCSADKTIKLWNIMQNDIQHQKTLYGHSKWVWDCAFSCDTDFLISVSSDQQVKIWQTDKGEPVKNLKGPKQAINCIALHDTDSLD